MEFSSIFFVEVFLPVTAIVFYLLVAVSWKNRSIQNLLLLVFSILFYCWGGVARTLYLLFAVLFNYSMGVVIGTKNKFSRYRKLLFFISISVNLALLVYYKFFSVAPLAISFITFKSISYICDVYWGKYKCEMKFGRYALFVAFFPALIQGPIISYDDFRPQLNNRTYSLDKVLFGLKRFSLGLGKKVIIANTVGQMVDKIFGIESVESLGTYVCWLGVILYTLQIYFDFSGYSDMAIGIASIFGFEVKENFNLPYSSLSIKEFWNRWHISLGTWFKKYVYIPMGGNKKGLGRQLINLMVVFILTGFWHGSKLTFIIWGLYFGVLRVIEALFLEKVLKWNKIKIINWAYTLLAVMVGWVMFRSDSVGFALGYIKQMFAFTKSGLNVYVTNYLNIPVILAMIFGILLSGPIQVLMRKVLEKHGKTNALQSLDFAFQIIILVASIILIVSGSYSPSIYARF